MKNTFQDMTRLRLAYPLRCRGYWIEYLRLLLLMCSHYGVEVTGLSSNKQHSLQHLAPSSPVCGSGYESLPQETFFSFFFLETFENGFIYFRLLRI